MKRNILRLTAVMGLCLVVISCGRLLPVVPETSRAAAAVIDRLLLTNQGLTDIKGLGQMKLIHSDQIQSARMAWAGTFPDKLRIEIMGAPGVSLATLASDGQWLYLRLDQEDRFYKRKNGKTLLKGMVDIPISVQDILQIMGGKVPLMSHRSAVLIDSEAGSILELKDRWGRVLQKVFFNSETNHPIGFEILNSNGSIGYRADFYEIMRAGNYSVPQYLALSTPNGEHFELKVDRYWVNQPLPSSRFVLQPYE